MRTELSLRFVTGFRLLVFPVGVLLLAIGIWRGEAVFVLKRAILICLACIGIG